MPENIQKIRETYPEISLTVEYEADSHFVKFEAYQIQGHTRGKSGEFDVPFYERHGAIGSGDETGDTREAQTIISGTVKWDGCSHYTFGDNDGYIHLCGRNDIFNVSAAIEKIFFRCGELMPGNFDPEEFIK